MAFNSAETCCCEYYL